MNLDKYQIFVNDLFIRSDDPKNDELRIITGIMGETGECMEKVKKSYRDGITDIDAWRDGVKKEVGDALFYWTHFCNFYDFSMDKILEENITKLYDRKERKVLKGEGDNR